MKNVKIRLQVTTIFKIYILSVFFFVFFVYSKPNYTAKYYLSFCCFFIRYLFNVYFLYQLHLNIIFMFHSLYFTFVIPSMLQCITSLCKIVVLNCILCNFHFRIYPIGLEIKKTTYTAMSPSYLDLEIDSEAQLRTKLYNKRDDFDVNFPNVNFPFMCSNIPAVPAYGVYISELIRYCRACGSHHELLDRWMLLTMELLLCSIHRTHNPVLSAFMSYHRVCNKRNPSIIFYICSAQPLSFSEVVVLYSSL